MEIQNEIVSKKLQLQKNIDMFFRKFKETNKMIFAKLKNTIYNEKSNLLSMIESLKARTNTFANDELMLESKNAVKDLDKRKTSK